MKAVIVEAAGGPEQLRVREVAELRPAAGEALIHVAYSPLNPLDVQARAGRIRWAHPGFPFTPGCGFSGRVVEVGAAVDAGLVGQRVSVSGVWGGNAEFAVAPIANLKPIPEHFDWQLGSVWAGTARTAWHLVHSAGGVAPGQVVVVHSAAGAVGALTAQVARSAGALTIGLAGGPAKAEFAARFADHALDYSRDDWPVEVKRLSGGRGADLVIDGNSGPRAALNYDALAPLGQVLYMGAMAGAAPDVSIPLLIGRAIRITGFVVNYYEARDADSGRAETEERLANGSWQIPIGRIADLDAVAELHASFENRELCGRALVRVNGEL